ncbi:hydantoinase/oxoprolinase family protein [Larkinella soli]|uniref:hydantoinase/oxoprolinase family protein n=1 Tax=Larkinella soli TaxID=1770527 RepID=UPI000FFC91D6|nr:hydantoinase/oxoprolinase family protein [Larkinella soli]
MSRYRFSIDLGETFTDFVLIDEAGRLSIKKIPTTFHDSIRSLVDDVNQFVKVENQAPVEAVEAHMVGMSVQMPPESAIDCVRHLEQELRSEGWNCGIRLVATDGRLLSVEEAAADPEQIMNPRIGGVVTGQFFGRQIGRKNLILLRIGGSSALIAMLDEVSDEAPTEILVQAGRSLSIGGNSYVGIDSEGAITILTDHATPGPGPACFNRGGTRPTLTDVDLILGYLNRDFFLYGAIPLSMEAARRAIDEHIARPLALTVEEASMRVCRQMEKQIADVVRELAGNQPVDFSRYTMLAFGGAGPVHASDISLELGIKEFVVPVGAGVASALGYLLAVPDDANWKTPPIIYRAGYYNPKNREGDFHALKGYRSVYYETDLIPCGCPIYDRAGIRADDSLSGPAIIEGPETTVVIREKSFAQMDSFRNLRISLR